MNSYKDFGGPGERINIVPMLETVNQSRIRFPGEGGSYRNLEKLWNNILEKYPSPEIYFREENIFGERVNTPKQIVVNWWLNGKAQKQEIYYNEPPFSE